MTTRALFVSISCGTVLTVCAGLPALAADATQSDDLAEVIVTAQKRAENIQNVPLSIVSVSGEALRAAGITSPLDLGKLVPSLRVYTAGIYNSGVAIRIRGFGSAPGNSANDADVASYLDGAFIPRPGALLSSFLDISNVEVLSGPQGTLFGRNAAMGALSINTNAPDLTRQSYSGTLEGGTYGTYAVTGIANAPVSEDFAVRVAVKANHSDGAYRNLLDGKKYGRSNGLVGRISSKWAITPDLTWVVRLDGSRTRGDGINDETIYTATATAAQLTALTAFVARNGGSSPVYSDPPSRVFNQVVNSPYLHDEQWGATSDLAWDLSPTLTLRLLDNYRDWKNDQLVGDAVALPVDLTTSLLATSSKTQSHELQLISSKDAYLHGKLGFTAGLYYYREVFTLNTSVNQGTRWCSVLFGARAPQLVPACLAGPQINAGYDDLRQPNTSIAGYGQISYKILPQLDLDLGARVSSDKKSGVLNQVARNAVGISALIVNEGPDYLSADTDKTSVHASLSWHVTDRIMPFVSYSTGYKSGGFSAQASATVLGAAARTYAPETVEDYEAGLKSTLLDDKLVFNATVFQTDLHNFQDRSYNGTSFIVRNAGDVRSRGVDFNGQFRAFRGLNFTYGATYQNSIYTSNSNAPGLEGCTGLPGCPTTQNLSGAPVVFSPKWSGYAGLDWKVGEFGGYATSLNVHENFNSRYFTASTNNPQGELPGVATTDVRLTVSAPSGNWRVELFGSNVFDKRYYSFTLAQPLAAVMGVNNTATGATIFRGFLADPARFGMRISADF